MLKPSGCPGLRQARAVPSKLWGPCREAWVGQGYLTHTVQLRQAMGSQQGQLSRVAVRDVLWPAEPSVPSQIRQVRPREKG